MNTDYNHSGHHDWPIGTVKLMQNQLHRLGLYHGPSDGNVNPQTEAGFVEAFASDDWQRLAPEVVLEKLNHAKMPHGPGQAGTRFRYGSMFKDGILDITLGVGHNEDGWDEVQCRTIVEVVFPKLGFEERDAAAVGELYARAKRAHPPSMGRFFVRKTPILFTTPIGEQKEVTAIVHMDGNNDQIRPNKNGRRGAEAAQNFGHALQESDIAYYSGHARYGSSLDFDHNIAFEYKGHPIGNYQRLERWLAEQFPKQKIWTSYHALRTQGLLVVKHSNDGNIFLNPTNRHTDKFGAHLMYETLQDPTHGAPLATGPAGTLAQPGNNKDRLAVIEACSSNDYAQAIRSTPGMGADHLDLLDTTRTTSDSDIAAYFERFLRGIIAQQSAETIMRNMDKEGTAIENFKAGTPAFHMDGFSDNPRIK